MKKVMAILMLLLAVSAWAQTGNKSGWNKIASEEDRTVYLHLASYAAKGNIATIWMLEDFTKSQTNVDQQPYQSVKKLLAIDCAERTITTKYQVVHAGAMGQGSLVTESEGLQKTTPVAPGTITETVFRWVCR